MTLWGLEAVHTLCRRSATGSVGNAPPPGRGAVAAVSSSRTLFTRQHCSQRLSLHCTFHLLMSSQRAENDVAQDRVKPVDVVARHPGINNLLQPGEALRFEKQRTALLFEAIIERFHPCVVLNPAQHIGQPKLIDCGQLVGPLVADKIRTATVADDRPGPRIPEPTQRPLGALPGLEGNFRCRAFSQGPAVDELAAISQNRDQVSWSVNIGASNPGEVGVEHIVQLYLVHLRHQVRPSTRHTDRSTDATELRAAHVADQLQIPRRPQRLRHLVIDGVAELLVQLYLHSQPPVLEMLPSDSLRIREQMRMFLFVRELLVLVIVASRFGTARPQAPIQLVGIPGRLYQTYFLLGCRPVCPKKPLRRVVSTSFFPAACPDAAIRLFYSLTILVCLMSSGPSSSYSLLQAPMVLGWMLYAFATRAVEFLPVSTRVAKWNFNRGEYCRAILSCSLSSLRVLPRGGRMRQYLLVQLFVCMARHTSQTAHSEGCLTTEGLRTHTWELFCASCHGGANRAYP